MGYECSLVIATYRINPLNIFRVANKSDIVRLIGAILEGNLKGKRNGRVLLTTVSARNRFVCQFPFLY